ncbi:hypothetical protein D3C71_1743930 [compost metagenome]
MAGQRRHDQRSRLPLHGGEGGWIVRKALETAQFAKWLGQLHTLVHRNVVVASGDGVDVECGFLVILAQAVEQVKARRSALDSGGLTDRPQGIAQHLGCGVRVFGKRLHQGALGFVELVQHQNSVNVASQYNSTVLRRESKFLSVNTGGVALLV